MAGKLPVFFIDASPSSTRRAKIKKGRRRGRWVPLRMRRIERKSRMNDKTRSPWPAVGVVILGLGLAWCFQHRDTSSAAGSGTAQGPGQRSGKQGEPLTLRVPASDTAGDAAGQAIGPATLSDSRREVESRTPVCTNLSAPAWAETPPPMERQYGKLLKQLAPLSITAETFADTKLADTPLATQYPLSSTPEGENKLAALPVGSSDKTGAPGKTSPALPGKRRTHVIGERDTLASIAERYYGSAEFAGRIFAANRHILEQPDLLPVGKTLELPDLGTPVGPAPLEPLPVGTEHPADRSPQVESDSPHPAASTQLVPLR